MIFYIPAMIKLSQRPKPPARMRRDRLGRLSAPQELFVENLVTHGAVYILERGGVEIGYAITNGAGQIVEFHVEDLQLPHAGQALDALVELFGARSILAQSFDPLLMCLGLACGSAPVTQGLLYRVIADPGFEPRSDIAAGMAKSEDVTELAALSDDFFDDAGEISAYRAAGGLMVYRDACGNLIGAGVFKPVVDGMDGVDIGMVVSPRHRRLGFGAYIVRHLKAHCLARGWRPSADAQSTTSPRRALSSGRVLRLCTDWWSSP